MEKSTINERAVNNQNLKTGSEQRRRRLERKNRKLVADHRPGHQALSWNLSR